MSNSFIQYLYQHTRFNIEEFCNALSFNDVIADLFISDKCNNKCRHCYFGNTSNVNPSLSLDDWVRVVDKLYDIGVRHFHFSGKESSLYDGSIDLMSYIKSFSRTYAGIVTNGLGEIKYYKRLLQTEIDYLEFSVDGLKENHDFIRGGNFFDKTFDCIKELKDYSYKFNLTTCLNHCNFNDYISLISTFNKLGITRFFATPFVLKGRAVNIADISITIDEYSSLLQDIFKFLQQMPNAKLQIRCCIPTEYTYKSFESSDFFRQIIKDYIEKGKDSIFRINGNVIQLSFQYIDIDYANTITISNDGYIIPCADDISNNDYYLHSLGNIKNINTENLKQLRTGIINNQLLIFLKNYGNTGNFRKTVE